MNNFGGAPALLARNSAAAEKRGRAKIPSPQPPSFLPSRAEIFFRIQSPDFREKKFGFHSEEGAKSFAKSCPATGFYDKTITLNANCVWQEMAYTRYNSTLKKTTKKKNREIAF